MKPTKAAIYSFAISVGAVCGIGAPVLLWKGCTNWQQERLAVYTARMLELQPIKITPRCRYYVPESRNWYLHEFGADGDPSEVYGCRTGLDATPLPFPDMRPDPYE